MEREAKNPVKATRRSFDILETLYEMGAARLTEIADALDLSNSTAHNHLSTLVECGFVTRDGERYRIGLRFLTYGEFARSRYKISQMSRSELTDLADESRESASVVVIEDGRGYVLDHYQRRTEHPLDLYPGKRIPLHATSFGKVLLADLPDERIEATLDRRGLVECTAETITDRSELLEELSEIRSRGYSISDEERLRGVRSVATAVRNEQGIAVGAVGITGATSRVTRERIHDELLEAVIDTKNVIELQIAYS